MPVFIQMNTEINAAIARMQKSFSDHSHKFAFAFKLCGYK